MLLMTLLGTVGAVIAAIVGVWVLCLMKQYRREDTEAAERDRQRREQNLRATLRVQFESIQRVIPNVQAGPGSHVTYTVLSATQMQPVESVRQSLDQLYVLPDTLQGAVREAYDSARKMGPPYTSVTPPNADVLKAKETVANVLRLL